MPAIYLFQKRTLLGGDDLHFPALLTILTRVVQGALLILPQCFYLIREAGVAAEVKDDGSAGGGRNWNYYLLEFLLTDPQRDDDDDDDDGISSSSCHHSHFFPLLTSMYLLACLLFGVASIALEYKLWWWSGQGTPTMHRQPRTSKVEGLLECKLCVFTVLLTMILAIYLVSMIFFASVFLQCRAGLEESSKNHRAVVVHWIGSKSWWLVSVLLAISQLTEVLIAVVFWMRLVHVNKLQTELLLDPRASLSTSTSPHHQHYYYDNGDGGYGYGDGSDNDFQHELTEELWADRCQWMCQCLSMSTCFIFGGQDFITNSTGGNSGGPNGGGVVPYYKQLSQALADYLETRGTLDVVPTDLVTGLLVLQRLQRQRILQARLQVVRSSLSINISQTQLQIMQRSAVLSTTAELPRDTRRNLHADGSYDRDDSSPSSTTGTTSSTRHLTRSVSDVPGGASSISKRRSNSSSITASTLRSRVGSTNDLKRTATTTNTHTATPPTASMTSMSLDLPETTRLVNTISSSPTSTAIRTSASSPIIIIPSTQPIYRRLDDHGEELHHSSSSPSPRRLRLQTAATAAAASSPMMMRTMLATSPLSSSSPPPPFYQTQTRAVLNPHNPIDLLRLQEGARMAKYALGIYTWMLYLFVHPVTGIPRLLCRSCDLCQRGRCCNDNPRRRRTDLVPGDDLEPTFGTAATSSQSMTTMRGTTIGDNLCGWHQQSLLLVAGIPEADLIYAQFVNRFSLVPYCILLDHESQSVVVSVRGSLSLDDLVTDVHIDPQCVYDLGQKHGFEVDENQYCHAGVVASARNLYADLERHGLLEQLLRNDYPDYHLRLVGHSLGAGICTLLGYMLKSRFPSLRVFNFSPPGCTMTWELATKCESWATSYILDSDIVPRLSVLALERLRDEVLELVARLKVPKYQVAQSFWTGNSRRACFWGASTDNASQDLEDLNELIDEWLFEEEEEGEEDPAAAAAAATPPSSSSPSFGTTSYRTTSYYQQLQEYWRIQDERKQTRGSTRSVRLYPPGRMIQLLKTGEEGGFSHVAKKVATCCTTNSGFQYTPVYIANDDLDEIVVSPTMATDHFVDRMFDELFNLAKTYEATMVVASSSLTSGGDEHDVYVSGVDMV